MAATTQNQVSQLTNTVSSKTDDLWNIFTYGAKSYIDKETRADDTHITGQEELMYGNSGYYAQQGGGINPQILLLLAAGGLAVFLIARRKG